MSSSGISVSVLLSRYRDEYDPEILGIFTSHDAMKPAFAAVVKDAHDLGEDDTEDAWGDLMNGGFDEGSTCYWYENHTLDQLSVGLSKEEHNG